jgi:CheY-like chemotaxis protein
LSRPALLIDDNDDYAGMLLEHLVPRGFRFDRAFSAREGLQAVRRAGPKTYELMVTDITMDGHTAGLRLIRKVRRAGYRGVLIVASTGFNFPLVLHLSRPVLRFWGVDVLVPKEPLKRGRFEGLAISKLGRQFLRQ